MQLEPRHLRTIVVVADTGSISSAARALGVAQPTLTTQLRRIESACGFALFVRDACGVRLTEPGRAVLDHARAVTTAPRTLDAEPQSGLPPAVRIGGSPGVLDQLLPHLVGHCADAVWSTTTARDPDLVRGLTEGRCDLALFLRWPHLGYLPVEGLARRQLLDAPLCVLLPDTQTPDGPIRLRQLAGRRWVLRTDADARRSVLRECERAGFTPDVRFWVDGPATVAALVARKEAVALEPVLCSVPAGVVAVPYHPAAGFRVELLYRRRRGAPAAFTDLLDAVALAVATHRPGAGQRSGAKGP